MQIIEHNNDRLILSFQRSYTVNLVVGIGFALVGFFFFLIGLLLIRQKKGIWILSSTIGIMGVAFGIFWVANFPKTNTFTFDKSRNHLLWEQQSLHSKAVSRSLEIPLHLIAGVEIASPFSGADSPDLYYPNLILDNVYWRIHLDSDGRYDTAITIAKTVSQFLQLAYFSDESKAPLRLSNQKILEEEIERLQQHLNEHPLDAEAHQELGILMRSNREESTAHLKQAESLFEAQQENDRAVFARVLQGLVNWKY